VSCRTLTRVRHWDMPNSRSVCASSRTFSTFVAEVYWAMGMLPFYNSVTYIVLLTWVIILIFIYILCDDNALTLIWVIVFVPTRVWKHVVQKGDTVIDATCGNGFDTLALRNLVADESDNGYVYALDIQTDALDKTSLLLEESISSNEVRTTEEWRFQLSIGVEYGSVLFRKKRFSQIFHFVFAL